MALSEDQKAMLRLLAQGGQGYEDIAALMGISAAEVERRAREAVKDLEAEGIPAPTLPEGPGGAAAPEPPPPAPEPPAAKEPEPRAPKAAAPKPEPVREAKPKPAAEKRERPSISLPSGSAPWIAVAAGLAVIVVVAVVLIVSGGGDDRSNDGGEGGATTTSEGTPAADAKGVTKAVLEPVGGVDADGVALFGRVKNTLALQVQAANLEPTANGETYAIWLAASPQKMLPLAEAPVNEQGRIAAQFEVPTEVLGYLATETFDQIAITRVNRKQLRASLTAATKAKEAPTYTGTEVLNGTISGPIIGAALREKEEKGE